VSRLIGLRACNHLLDAKIFAGAKKGEGGHSVVWAKELDMDADRLWEIALEQTAHQDTVEYLRWR
jgi:hypothetical protein